MCVRGRWKGSAHLGSVQQPAGRVHPAAPAPAPAPGAGAKTAPGVQGMVRGPGVAEGPAHPCVYFTWWGAHSGRGAWA